MTREEIGEFFRLHEKALRAHDFDALMALYAEDCVVESPIFGVVTGRAAIEQAWRISLTRIPDLRTETEKVIVMGHNVGFVCGWVLKSEDVATARRLGVPAL